MMRIERRKCFGIFVLILLASSLFAQDDPVDRVSLKLSDPARPGNLHASLINGSITVEGYDGDEIIVEARARGKRYSKNKWDRKRGLKRLVIASTGLEVEEQRNRIKIGAASHSRTVDIDIRVPRKVSLKLSTINSGKIVVRNIEGELDLNNINGSIEAYDISGAVVANTTNGKVEITFDKIDPDTPMSFVSFNGKVDVTFPDNIKADVKMKSDQGEIYSDFDIMLEDKPRLIREDTRKRGGKYKVKVESTIFGTINGGGPQFHFSTYNGSIYIRKKS